MTVGFAPGRIATITLSRPERRNALDRAMLAGLADALSRAAADEASRVVLLRGDGADFCAGADVGDVAESAAGGARYGSAFEDLLRSIETHPLPVVARVHGAALGAGCQILAACDVVVAANDATIGIPSARLGLLLDLEKIDRMLRVVGAGSLRQMLLAGVSWTGEEAQRIGLVAAAVPAAALDDETDRWCERIAGAAPLSVRGSKAAIAALLAYGRPDRERDAALFAEHDVRAARALSSEDLREGVAALRERRAPRFTGR